jgi:hypothetical protein
MRTEAAVGQSRAVSRDLDPIVVELELECGGEVIRGQLTVRDQPAERFSGPLELMAMVREATAVEEPADGPQSDARHPEKAS